MKKISLLVISASLLAVYTSCTKDTTTAATTPSPTTCDSVSAKFSANIKPIFQAKCGGNGCHPSNGDVLTYSALKGHVDDGHITSKVVNKTGGQMPPAGSTQLTSDEIKKVSCWVSGGAQNN